MTSPAPDEFDRIIKDFTMNSPTENIDPAPYGTTATAPAHTVKAGLTKRGKAALGIGAAVIAGGSLIGYQAHAAGVAEQEAKAQELALKVGSLELEKLREQNRTAAAQRKEQVSAAKARQASVDDCVKEHQDEVGEGFGAATLLREVVETCQAQYTGTFHGDSLEPASSQQTASSGDNGGVNQGALVGGVVLAAFLGMAAWKGKRSNPA